jgi:hypothetical protein
MTTETIQPQPESGPASDNGQVQSQGHRRRRRRRKNKSGQQPAQPQQPQMQQPQQQQPQQPKPANQHQHQHQHQGRKKKKFFQKPQPQASQPGNSMAPQQQGKRRGKQKGPREFVGPMDHSYRAVNGNVADAPPSTIQFMGGSYNGNYMDSHAPQQPAAVRHDAPTRIFCFIEDLFLQAKIQENARKLGIKVEFVKGDKDVVSRLTEVPEADRPTLLVFDLNNLNAKPMALIPKLKAKLKKATSIVGFLHHLQGDLKVKAIEAGCDTVMPRSAFSQSLPNLLRRYGIVEEEEDLAQQPM